MFETVALNPRIRPAELVSREWLTDEYVRVRLAGEALVGFESPGSDDHVRLFFLPEDAAAPNSPDGWRAFHSREYTPVAFDADAGWADFEMLVHGRGRGSDFAERAPIGAPIAVAAPRRSRRRVGTPDSIFLAGAETSLPAINRFLGLRPPDAPATVLLEVSCANRRVPLSEGSVDVTWLIRPEQRLAGAITSLTDADRPHGDVFAFVAGRRGSSRRPGTVRTLATAARRVRCQGYWRG